MTEHTVCLSVGTVIVVAAAHPQNNSPKKDPVENLYSFVSVS